MIFPLSLPPALALALALAQFPPSSRDRDPREAGFVPPFAPPVRSQPGSDHRPTTRPPPPPPPVPVPVPRFHSRRRDRSQLQTALPAVFNLGQPAKNVITFFPRTVEHYARPRAVPDASRPEYSLHGFAAAAAPPPPPIPRNWGTPPPHSARAREDNDRAVCKCKSRAGDRSDFVRIITAVVRAAGAPPAPPTRPSLLHLPAAAAAAAAAYGNYAHGSGWPRGTDAQKRQPGRPQ